MKGDNTNRERKKYILFLSQNNEESRRLAVRYLRDIGIRILNCHGNIAMVVDAKEDQIEVAQKSPYFLGLYSKHIQKVHFEKLTREQIKIAELWNFSLSEEYKETKKDYSQINKKWTDDEKEQPVPFSVYDPDFFKEKLLKHLGISEKELIKRSKGKNLKRISGKTFIEFERNLADKYKNQTIAYHLTRIAYHLDPIYYELLERLPKDFLKNFFQLAPEEPSCWKLENEISVGVVFVESSKSGGPKFSSSERSTIMSRIVDGLDWLAAEAPVAAHLTWVYDWQYVEIDVANGNNSSNEPYWRNPGMGKVNYNGNTYSQDMVGVANYREDMRTNNLSAHAAVIFVTPYGNSWHAYASSGRITLAKRNNWGNWGINTLDMITAHEMLHLFGAADEYTGSGTPCSSCGSLHGCFQIPNGNCGSCASPQLDCVMDANSRKICSYTQGQIGWADLFVELRTSNDLWSGTDDDVWLDIGDRTFYLDTINHNDRERGNIEGYALNYTGVTKNDIKRVGIRKSSDGFAGGWKLARVRLWCRGELICDANVNKWLEDDQRWWVCGNCGSSSEIINMLKIKVTTADVAWAGTDDNVKIYLGGRSWNLDNTGRDDFERGRTDTFELDPGPNLYKSMISSIRIHKSPDGIAGGWKLKGLKIYVNGNMIYNKQNINKWLEDNDRDWYSTV